MEARLFDAKDTLSLGTRNLVRFDLSGDGQLIDNLGTSAALRVVQLYNGRAMINLKAKAGEYWVSVKSEGFPTAFLKVV